MNIFGFRPFKGRFNLGNSDDIPTNNDGTLIGAIKQISTHLTASNDAPFRFAYNSSTQEYGYIIDEGGADTFRPFKSKPSSQTFQLAEYISTGNATANITVPNLGYSKLDFQQTMYGRWVAIIGRKADSSTVTLFQSVTDTNIHTFTGMSDYVEVVIHNNNSGTADANTISVRLYD